MEQPAAQTFFRPDVAAEWDAYLMYDMPGYTFHADHSSPEFHDPPAEFRRNFADVVDAGHGFVFLHHALASWPTWPLYAQTMGGRFRFVADRSGPDSGYRHEVEQRIEVVDRAHPVVAGLGEGFDICDETYLCEVGPDVRPLLRTTTELSTRTLWSTGNAVAGRRDTNDGWVHPPNSDGVVAWVVPHERSRIVYIQFGDGPSAFGNNSFRRLLTNALGWVAEASPSAISRADNRRIL